MSNLSSLLDEYADLITARMMAEYLQVTPSTLRRWADEGKIRCVRTVGGHRRYHRADADAIKRGDWNSVYEKAKKELES